MRNFLKKNKIIVILLIALCLFSKGLFSTEKKNPMESDEDDNAPIPNDNEGYWYDILETPQYVPDEMFDIDIEDPLYWDQFGDTVSV